MKTTKSNLKAFALALCALVLLVTIGTGCRNTAHGIGQDVERAGEKIQEKTD
jgi:predicted small secreted protein